MKTASNEQGNTMLQTILYIGFLIIIGGWLASIANNAMQRYKLGRVSQQILDLKKAVSHFTATTEDYSNLTIAAMNAGSSLPMDMRTGNNTTAKHALGGEVKLGPATDIISGTEKPDYKYLFYITFKNINRKACVELLSQGQFYGDGSDLDTLIVNSRKAWRYKYSIYPETGISHVTELTIGTGSASSAQSIHLTVTEALDACTDKNNNTITWIFS